MSDSTLSRHRAVAHRIGARSACHAAKGGISAGIDGEKQADAAQVLVELLVGDTGFHRHVEVTGIDLHNPVHRRELEADPAPQRRNVTLEGRPGSERDDWHLVARADFDDFAHLASRVHEDDGVRRHTGMVRRILPVPPRIAATVDRRLPSR